MLNIKRQKLFFFSLTGIVVVSLIMMTSFAYQRVQVKYNSNSNNGITLKSGVLDVSFESSEYISSKNMPLLKDYKNGEYSEFKIDNSNSTEDVSFYIELTELEFTENLIIDEFKYTLIELENNKENVVATGDFSNLSYNDYRLDLNSKVYLDIEKNQSKTYRLYLWLQETENDQNYLENASFKGKIRVTSLFKSAAYENSLAYNIINNASNNYDVNRTKLSDKTSLESKKLIKVNENNQEYYYFNGDVVDNYVYFDNMCFRVVKIDADKSTELILQDVNGDCSKNNYIINELDYGYKIDNDNIIFDRNKMLENIKSFEDKLKSKNKIKIGNWCYSNKAYSYDTLEKLESFDYNNNVFYESFLRINGKIENQECSEELVTNNMYVGLIDVMDLYNSINSNNDTYLDNATSWWTNNLSRFENNVDKAYIYENGNISEKNVNDIASYRPVIRLANGVSIIKGDGTKENPYVIG